MRLYSPKIHDAASVVCWRWRDIITPGSADLYLRRLYILRAWCGAMLHWIHRPDSDRWLHDHPWCFFSIVLRGGYVEETPRGVRRVRWFNCNRSTDLHRILSVEPGTITLVFTGPKVRSWGFQTDLGWVGWREYLAEKDQ